MKYFPGRDVHWRRSALSMTRVDDDQGLDLVARVCKYDPEFSVSTQGLLTWLCNLVASKSEEAEGVSLNDTVAEVMHVILDSFAPNECVYSLAIPGLLDVTCEIHGVGTKVVSSRSHGVGSNI